MDNKQKQRLDMDLSQPPKTGMLGQPNGTGVHGRSYGDDQLRAIMGMAAMQPQGRR